LQGNLKKSLPKTQFSVFCFFAPFFQRKEQGSKGRRPLGETRPQQRRGSAPATPARGIFEKIPLHPKNFWNSKKLRFLQGDPEKPLPKTQFSAFCFFASFFQRKKRGSKGQRPLGETRPSTQGLCPCHPGEGDF